MPRQQSSLANRPARLPAFCCHCNNSNERQPGQYATCPSLKPPGSIDCAFCLRNYAEASRSVSKRGETGAFPHGMRNLEGIWLKGSHSLRSCLGFCMKNTMACFKLSIMRRFLQVVQQCEKVALENVLKISRFQKRCRLAAAGLKDLDFALSSISSRKGLLSCRNRFIGL